MDLIANMLLATGAFGAAAYCYVLAVRLKKFSTLESGMGGAIAVLSVQVDDMTRALDKARGTAADSAASLDALALRAESAAVRLELLLASLHDLPGPDPESAVDRAQRLRFVRRRAPRDSEAAE